MSQLSVGDRERAERALKRSVIKRDKIVSEFGVLATMGSKVSEDNSLLSVFEARSQDLSTLLSEFHVEQDAILDQLLLLDRDSEFSIQHAQIETQNMEKYYQIRSINAELNINTSNVENNSNILRQNNINIQLPKIQLPTFDGDLLKWCSYRDTFLSLVHENLALSDIEKFHYLVSSVSGSAAPIVKAVPLAEANYVVAWEALQENYNNKRMLITNHLDVLFRTPIMTTETLVGLTEFLSTFRENVAAIRALEVVDLTGFLLFYIASRVLSSTTKRLFEAEHHKNDTPNIDLLLKFVQTRCQILQNSVPHTISSNKSISLKPNKLRTSLIAATTDSKLCKFCKGSHYLHQCTKFSQLPVNQRFNFTKSQRLCKNCLSPQHKTGECTSTHVCRQCSMKHHTLLHLEKKVPKETMEGDNSLSVESTASSNTTSEVSFTGAASSPGNVILGTALIRIQNSEGQWMNIRALIDTGCQISVITSSFVSRLGLKRRRSHTSIIGVSQTKVSSTKGSTNCIFTSIYSESLNIKCEPMILSQIVQPMPSSRLHSAIHQAYKNITLADPQFDIPGQIDFLLGADVYPFILGESSRVIHTPNLPSAYETKLGWIILGKDSKNISSSSISLLLTTEQSVSHLIRKFWEIEEPAPPATEFTEDQKCEAHFLRTTTRDSTGRLTVSLPFREDPSSLGESRSMAVSRFYNLERKLQRDPMIYDEYRKFMTEYEQLVHMQIATNNGNYYIPHHAVVKQTEDKIKLRVVFDASAASSTGKSLNELVGNFTNIAPVSFFDVIPSPESDSISITFQSLYPKFNCITWTIVI